MARADFPRYGYDDDLIEAVRSDGVSRVRVYRLTDTAVVLGAGGRPDRELRLEACLADKVPILRRRGGGCAVVLDPGNVIVSVAATGLTFGHHRQHFDVLSDWLIAALGDAGLSGVSRNGICDLVVGDKKVGGACLHRTRDLLYYCISLLVTPDLSKVTRYLQHPPREPDYRRGRSHAEFMGALTVPAANGPSCAERLAAQLRRTLQPPLLRPLR